VATLTLSQFSDKLFSGFYGRPKDQSLIHLRNNFLVMKGSVNKSKAELVNKYIESSIEKSEDVLETKQQSALESSESDFDLLVAGKLSQLKCSAERRGKEFDLTFNVVKRLMKRKTCYYTGLKFQASPNLHLTIDRVDFTKGYVIGNVVACSNWANQMKNQLIEQEGSPLLGNPRLLKRFLNKLGE